MVMSVDYSHITTAKARELQDKLAKLVIKKTTFSDINVVAGIDVSIRNNRAIAAIVALSIPKLEVLEKAIAVRPVEFPYVPGLLAFREAPVIFEAFDKLKIVPDILVVDGQGYAHPRRLGLACHLGVELDLPSIGCAKSRLTGIHREPGQKRGSRVALTDKGETIGAVVRTRENVKPVYISIGHRIDLDTAVKLILRLCSRYRLPEPIREAHKTAGSLAVT
ncbi:Endonuclease V [hydrothermal vent metagenome]|uniref:Endonuclease V n=1 Tax=hydrothermal vent metagenome TaxID=652676 RepID=A0A3B1BVV5_9ZZZZ